MLTLAADALVNLTLASWCTVGICAACACVHAALSPEPEERA